MARYVEPFITYNPIYTDVKSQLRLLGAYTAVKLEFWDHPRQQYVIELLFRAETTEPNIKRQFVGRHPHEACAAAIQWLRKQVVDLQSWQ